MKEYTNLEKIKILKKAKSNLTGIQKFYGYDTDRMSLCYILRDIISDDMNGERHLCWDIQKMFDMDIVRPDDKANFGYWWEFDKGGYLQRHKSLNKLIDHFKDLYMKEKYPDVDIDKDEEYKLEMEARDYDESLQNRD